MTTSYADPGQARSSVLRRGAVPARSSRCRLSLSGRPEAPRPVSSTDSPRDVHTADAAGRDVVVHAVLARAQRAHAHAAGRQLVRLPLQQAGVAGHVVPRPGGGLR
eukprot:826610-Prymnesium_polylepis.1